MNNESFNTIITIGAGDYRERGSKFFSSAYPIISMKDVKTRINTLRKEHSKSTHVCSAYILRSNNETIEKPNDDGEPSGSAGLPILNAIKSKKLQNVLVCVVRYYGGTKLGVSGLIHAYRSSAALALENVDIIEQFPMTSYRIGFEYERMGILMSLLKEADLEIIDKHFDTHPSILIAIKSILAPKVIYQLKRKILNLPSDYRDEITSIPGISIKAIND